MTRVVLYGRVDCHLCDEMKVTVETVRRSLPFSFEIVDVDTDPALISAYGADVPVLTIDGRKAFKYRVTVDALSRRLRRNASGGGEI